MIRKKFIVYLTISRSTFRHQARLAADAAHGGVSSWASAAVLGVLDLVAAHSIPVLEVVPEFVDHVPDEGRLNR
jgi:hypothetical protein